MGVSPGLGERRAVSPDMVHNRVDSGSSHSCRKAAPGMMKMAILTVEAMSAAPLSRVRCPARPLGQGPTLLRDVSPAFCPSRSRGRGFCAPQAIFHPQIFGAVEWNLSGSPGAGDAAGG